MEYIFGLRVIVNIQDNGEDSGTSYIGRLCLYAIDLKGSRVKYFVLRSEENGLSLIKPLYKPEVIFIKETGLLFRGFIKSHDKEIQAEWLIKFNV
jgi:hypothetical protein